MARLIKPLLIVSLIVIIGACSPYQKLLKSTDYELKYKKAIEYYEEKNYARTIQLLDELIPIFRGTPKSESVNYYYAMAHYQIGDYILASHYFKNFAIAFPLSESVEEFIYLSAYCKYIESPRYNLDQTTTLEAIKELQGFINRYPKSARVEESNKLIDELRGKLERKAYENAFTYYQISDYHAALKGFENLVKDFPDTRYKEDAYFYSFKSKYEYAFNSIDSKKLERYTQAKEAFQKFEAAFPESKRIKEARSLNAFVEKEIQRFTVQANENK